MSPASPQILPFRLADNDESPERFRVNPKAVKWACEYSAIPMDELVSRFPKLPKWIGGDVVPTSKEAELFAEACYLQSPELWDEIPDRPLCIPDFRPEGKRGGRIPTASLIGTTYKTSCNVGYYDEFLPNDLRPRKRVSGSVFMDTEPVEVAYRMRQDMDYTLDEQRACGDWAEAHVRLVSKAEDAGVLVMISGIVKNDVRRKLDTSEFTGFAEAFDDSPFVFVNGSDIKAAVTFTLAHGLAHVWLGANALSNIGILSDPSVNAEESWCHEVAAEFLLPSHALREALSERESPTEAMNRLSGKFNVSGLVALRRLHDIGWLDRAGLESLWAEEYERHRGDIHDQGDCESYPKFLERNSRRFIHGMLTSLKRNVIGYARVGRMIGVWRDEDLEGLEELVGPIR